MAYIVEITDIPPDQFDELAHQQTENGATSIARIEQANHLLTLRATYPGDDDGSAGGGNDQAGSSGNAGGGSSTGGGGAAGGGNPHPQTGSLSDAFRAHGTFIYDTPATIADYGSVQNTVDAMQRAGMKHAWIRIHGTQAYGSSTAAQIQELCDAMDAAGIAVAGWGWCQGANSAAEAKLAVKELKRYGLSDYVADIEHGTNNAQWTTAEIKDFCGRIRDAGLGSFVVSTYPLIDWHNPDLMHAAQDYVDAFAPQVYWFSFPNKKMVDQFQRPDGSKYRQNDASEYAELCLDRWLKLMGAAPKPLILTGQAYWGEGMTQQAAEQKLDEFLSRWNGYSRVVGVNWWHFGGQTGMSHAMLERIVSANLGAKPYQ